MNHSQIIRRAWEIVRSYRALWLFGLLVALSGGGGGAGNGMNFGSGDGPNSGDGLQLDKLQWPHDLPGGAWFQKLVAEASARNWSFDPDPALLGASFVLICGGILALILVLSVLAYLGRAAMMRMVDAAEGDGLRYSIGEGFGLALSGRTFRLFLLEFILGFGLLLVMLPLLLIAILPIAMLVDAGNPSPIGIVIGVGLLIIGIPLVILLAITWRLLSQFWSREVVVAGADIGQAVGNAFGLLRHKLAAVGLLWLIMLVVGFVVGMAMIPVALVLAAFGLLTGVGVGAAVFAMTDGAILALAAGLPAFLLLVGAPLLILAGIYSAFESSVWTLAWRSLTGRDLSAPDALPPADPWPVPDPDPVS
jgi:hypothetical protein